MADVDLLLIIGTTLRVGPFNVIPRKVPNNIPQVLINNDISSVRGGDQFTKDGLNMKLSIEGECDKVALQITEDCGWHT